MLYSIVYGHPLVHRTGRGNDDVLSGGPISGIAPGILATSHLRLVRRDLRRLGTAYRSLRGEFGHQSAGAKPSLLPESAAFLSLLCVVGAGVVSAMVDMASCSTNPCPRGQKARYAGRSHQAAKDARRMPQV